jgi:hypothetical protein
VQRTSHRPATQVQTATTLSPCVSTNGAVTAHGNLRWIHSFRNRESFVRVCLLLSILIGTRSVKFITSRGMLLNFPGFSIFVPHVRRDSLPIPIETLCVAARLPSRDALPAVFHGSNGLPRKGLSLHSAVPLKESRSRLAVGHRFRIRAIFRTTVSVRLQPAGFPILGGARSHPGHQAPPQ